MVDDIWSCCQMNHLVFQSLGMYRRVNDRGEEKPCQVAFNWFLPLLTFLSNWHSPTLLTCNVRNFFHSTCFTVSPAQLFYGASLCSPSSSIPNLGCHFHFRIWEWPWPWPWPQKCTLHMTEKRFQNSDVREVLHSCNVFVIWQHHNWVRRILQINHHPIITLFKGWLLKVGY